MEGKIEVTPVLSESENWHTELWGSYTAKELEDAAKTIKEPQTPPYSGKWKLISKRAFGATFPDGLSFEELERLGKVRISGKRWYRLFKLVTRWQRIDPSAPRGIALANAGKLACKHGHPLPPFVPGVTRRCTVCSRESARRSKAKARQKKAALQQKQSLGSGAYHSPAKPKPLTWPELDKKQYS